AAGADLADLPLRLRRARPARADARRVDRPAAHFVARAAGEEHQLGARVRAPAPLARPAALAFPDDDGGLPAARVPANALAARARHRQINASGRPAKRTSRA